MVVRSVPRRAFTLVEMLMVVVILGVLAAVLLPSLMGRWKSTAGEIALKDNLGVIRIAIQRYMATHGGHYPGQVTDGTSPECSEACFKSQLLRQTVRSGILLDAPPGTGLGPYLSTFPRCTVGPLIGEVSVAVVDEAGVLQADTDPRHAWKYSVRTGYFICNTRQLSIGEQQSYSIW